MSHTDPNIVKLAVKIVKFLFVKMVPLSFYFLLFINRKLFGIGSFSALLL